MCYNKKDKKIYSLRLRRRTAMGEKSRKTNFYRKRVKKLVIACVSVIILSVVLYYVGCWILEFIDHPLDNGLRNCIKIFAFCISVMQVWLSAMLYRAMKKAKEEKISFSDSLRVTLNNSLSWLD